MKKIALLLLTLYIFLAGNLMAQTSPDYIFGDDNGAAWDWTTGTQGDASLGNSFKWQFTATATADHYFKFGETSSNSDGSGFWTNNTSSDMQYTGAGAKWTAYYQANMSGGGAIYTAITSGNYYVVKTKLNGSDIDFAVFDNGAFAPVTITSVARTISGNDLTVTATASDTASANEKVWVRYSTDNWTSSHTAELTFTSGTSYAATITFSSGDFVSYYIYTTIQQTSAPAEADADFFTINYNNNNSVNYTVQIGPLSGDYYIPQNGNAKGYSSLANAFSNINEVGLSGTVHLYIDSDINETGANLLLSRSDLTATNNLVIKPAPTKTPTITISGCTATSGATQYAGLTLNATSYVTIDGSNTIDGTSKDLTIAMNDGTYGRLIINLYTNCDTITVKNTVLKFNAPMVSANVSSGIYANGLAAGACDSVTIQNNTIGDETNTPYYAVRITGFGTGKIYCNSINVLNNTLTAKMRTVYYYVVGSTGNTSSIIGNTIKNPSTTISGYVVYGVLLNTYGGTINISENQIVTLKTNNASNQGLYGISALTAQTGAVVNIKNNIIGDFYCLNGTSNTTPVSGIYWQTGGTVNIYYNTINLSPVNNTTNTVGALRFGSTANAIIKNNIIVNDYNTATSYGIYWASSGTLTSDYNDIYVPGADANVGYYTSARKTIVDWQTASSQDANSVSKAVNFVSATDLHLTGSSLGDTDLIADPSVGVTTDIDGETRSLTYPYKGADENLANLLPVELTNFNATVVNEGVMLNWSTATEVNNYGFEVERAHDNSQWEKIAFVEGHGNSNAPNDYTFTDANVTNGNYQYRLKQIDFDGTVAYSDVVEVSVNQSLEKLSLDVYPNPFNPSTTLAFVLPKASKVSLTIFDITGQKVAELIDNEVMEAGYHKHLFNAGNLASGIYISVLQAEGMQVVKKLQLLK